MITKEQTKNIIIISAVVILLALGFFFSRKNISEAPINEVVDEESSTNTENNPEEAVATPETKEDVVNTDSTDKQKFSQLLTDGNKEFTNKNYDEALKLYTKALDYSGQSLDVVYVRMFAVYNMQNNIEKARFSIDKAIAKSPSYTDYWVTKLVFLDEKTPVSFADLKKMYEEGLAKVDSRTKINLITTFARIAESNKENSTAISVWEKAKEVYPSNKDIYQKEIDRLKTL